jgi:hypothetical protein
MLDCWCGREVRLRMVKVGFRGQRGVEHWIEHQDTSRVCPPGRWSCIEWHPLQGSEMDREYWHMRMRWEAEIGKARKDSALR